MTEPTYVNKLKRTKNIKLTTKLATKKIEIQLHKSSATDSAVTQQKIKLETVQWKKPRK